MGSKRSFLNISAEKPACPENRGSSAKTCYSVFECGSYINLAVNKQIKLGQTIFFKDLAEFFDAFVKLKDNRICLHQVVTIPGNNGIIHQHSCF